MRREKSGGGEEVEVLGFFGGELALKVYGAVQASGRAGRIGLGRNKKKRKRESGSLQKKKKPNSPELGSNNEKGRTGNQLTRVVFKTLHNRGKSLTPASRIAMLDPRIAKLEWRDETQDASGWALNIFVLYSI